MLPNSDQYLFINTVLLFLKDSRGGVIAGETGCGVLIDCVHLPLVRHVYEQFFLHDPIGGKLGLKMVRVQTW